MLNKAWRLLERGQLDKAAAACGVVLAEQPNQVDATYLLGLLRLQQGRVSEARDHLSVALRVQPTNAAAHFNYGNVLVKLKCPNEALASYEKAIAFKPDLVAAYINRGNVLQELGRHEESVTSYGAALGIKPDSVEALFNRGNALNYLKRHEQALLSFDQVVALQPGNAHVHNSRGLALFYLKRLDEAAASYVKAISQQPKSSKAHNNYGNVLRAQDRLVEANASYRQSLQLNRAYIEIQKGIGIIDADGLRSLHLGTSVSQSSMRMDAPFELMEPHNRGLMAFLLFFPRVDNVLAIGLGGGSLPKFIYQYLPAIRTQVIEINADIITVARSHFQLPEDDDRLRVLQEDGARYLSAHPESTAALLVDIADSIGMPRNLYSKKFFDDCFSALSTGGIALIHLWSLDAQFEVYLDRIKRSFSGRILRMPVGHADNTNVSGSTIVIGFQQHPTDLSWSTLFERAAALGAAHNIEFRDFVERLRESNAGQVFDPLNRAT